MYKDDYKSFIQHMVDPYSLCRWISAEVDSQFAYKISDFRYPLFTGNEMLCYKERHPLLLKCIIQFLICTGMLRGALKSIRTRLNDGTMSFLPKTTVQFDAKSQSLGTLQAHKMGYYDTRRDIHCYLSVS